MTSIILPYYNRPDDIFDACLYSIANQNCNVDFEVLVIDDGSDHNIYHPFDVIRNYTDKLNIRYFYNNNPGFTIASFAINIGIKQSLYDYIIISSSDVVWHKDILKNFIEVFNKNLHKKIVIGTLVYGLNKHGTNKFLGLPKTERLEFDKKLNLPDLVEYKETMQLSEHCLYIYEHPKRENGIPLNFLTGYYKELLLDMQGFDEDIECGEDMVFIKRLQLANVQPIWLDLKCLHLYHYDSVIGYRESPRKKTDEIISKLTTYKANKNI